MADLNRIQAIVFDSYGTLFDLNQTNEECEKQYPENGAKIAQSWRQKQLQYSWLRALMDRYLDFKNITKDALVFVLKENQLAYDESNLNKMTSAYLTMSTFHDIAAGLKSLKQLV